MEKEPYHKHVSYLETGLAPYAKHSFEDFSPTFVDGAEIHRFYETQWSRSQSRPKLERRTPLQIERDRILYSEGMRKQTEKYHVLYNGQRRIVRNYITHTMRMAQVTRSICRGLELNSDFGEAVALGSKIGALPFIHASKDAVSRWVIEKIQEIDDKAAENDPLAKPKRKQLALEFEESSLPEWLDKLRSGFALDRVRRSIPWAAGEQVEAAYSSGQQSYWQLCTNRYHLTARPTAFCPETMYGIWRHTRGIVPSKNSFCHRCEIEGATSDLLEITWKNATYEAIVVQYADDITWILENLNDANTAALLNGRPSIYPELRSHLERVDELPNSLFRATSRGDAGALYTYFINDFVQESNRHLTANEEAARQRAALRAGSPEGLIVGCSEEGERFLEATEEFVRSNVFEEKRVDNRGKMLETLSKACIDLLYDGKDDALPRHIEERGALENWTKDETVKAIEAVDDPIHRIQIAVNVFSDMGDQEIYNFVGIDAL